MQQGSEDSDWKCCVAFCLVCHWAPTSTLRWRRLLKSNACKTSSTRWFVTPIRWEWTSRSCPTYSVCLRMVQSRLSRMHTLVLQRRLIRCVRCFSCSGRWRRPGVEESPGCTFTHWRSKRSSLPTMTLELRRGRTLVQLQRVPRSRQVDTLAAATTSQCRGLAFCSTNLSRWVCGMEVGVCRLNRSSRWLAGMRCCMTARKHRFALRQSSYAQTLFRQLVAETTFHRPASWYRSRCHVFRWFGDLCAFWLLGGIFGCSVFTNHVTHWAFAGVCAGILRNIMFAGAENHSWLQQYASCLALDLKPGWIGALEVVMFRLYLYISDQIIFLYVIGKLSRKTYQQKLGVSPDFVMRKIILRPVSCVHETC